MKIFITAMWTCFFIMPAIGCAAPVFPGPLHENGAKTETVYNAGDQVVLSHSGLRDAKNAIRINDILTVYRESPCCNLKEIGKIRVLSFTGNNHIRAEVIEGSVRAGDIAKKGAVSCLVLGPGCSCE
jgi:hypothetical protein